jgi:hypothetical protein
VRARADVPVAAVVATLLLRAAVGLTTRRRVDVRLTLALRTALRVGVLLALLALEVRQQLNADLLIQTWSG